MIISQILKPEMQIRKQKFTESKRFRPKRRADKKTTQIISGNLIWTELINGERKKYVNVRTGLAGGAGPRGRTAGTRAPADAAVVTWHSDGDRQTHRQTDSDTQTD
jgi:hypothetical protein